MDHLPPIELLESTHRFPGPYTFKAFGKPDHGFERRILTAAREAINSDTDPQFRTREARGGRHVCITLTLFVEKAAEIHQVYKRLLQVPGLILLL